MVFKLVRIDASEPCKIPLMPGKHLIGRGKFLDCTDTRVSRNHGELEVTEDTVTITSIHQNPCFYITKHIDVTHVLHKNETKSLTNGDKFGLVPDSYWYEIIHCILDTDLTKVVGNQRKNREDTNEDNRELELAMEENTEEMNTGDEDQQENLNTNLTNIPTDETRNDVSQPIGFELNETVEEEAPGSPSLIPPDNDSKGAETPTPISDGDSQPAASPEAEDQNAAPSDVDCKNSGPNTPVKRSHTAEDDISPDVKKVKTEPESPNDNPGPSNPAPDSPSQDVKPNVSPQSPPKPAAPRLRERCMYGANCYRRNPQHKEQYSHPSDASWGTGAQAECPWGAACARRDPRHWRDHWHPPGVQPPQPNAQRPGKMARPRKRTLKRDSNSDEDDSVDTDVIVTGKRNRRPVNRQCGSESESDTDEDPFQSDGSDEWEPSSNYTESQDY